MASLLVLDTDILIDVQPGYQPAVDWIGSLAAPPSITGFTAMELIQDARDLNEVRLAAKLAAPLTILWPTASDCQKALRLFEQHHLSHRLGLLDALIASTVLGLDAELCTFNSKHYRAITSLKISRPYEKQPKEL